MTNVLMKEHFDRALTKVAAKGDIAIVQPGLKNTQADVTEMKNMVQTLVASVDTYLKRTETWHDEFHDTHPA